MVGLRLQSNFSQLKAHDEQLERLGLLAERYFADDPNTCLLKLRQLTEGIAQSVASRVGLYASPDERQIDLLRRLQDHGILPREVGALFHEVRKAGNDANHKLAGDHRTALTAMRIATLPLQMKTGIVCSVHTAHREFNHERQQRNLSRPARQHPPIATDRDHEKC